MNGKIFEMNKEAFIILYKEKKSVTQIAKHTGYGIDAIRAYMKRNDISLKHKTIYSCNENFFAQENDETFYWAGFIAADGCVQARNRDYSFLVKLTLADKDREHLNKFKIALSSNHPIHDYVDKKGNKYCELIICSQIMCQDLAKFNIIPRKTYVYKFPEFLKNNKMVNSFIRGYIDGDGCFTEYKQKNRNISQITMNVVGTKEFLTEMYKIIDLYCDNTMDRKLYRGGNVFRVGYSGNKIISKIHKFLYKDSTIHLQRKYDISKKAIKLV